MARRTNTEAIRDLELTVARLDTLVIYIERGVKQVGADASELTKSVVADAKQISETVAAITTRLAVIEKRFEDLKQSVEQREQKRWAVALIVISALAGGVTSVLFGKLIP